jgi:hypothetical protein
VDLPVLRIVVVSVQFEVEYILTNHDSVLDDQYEFDYTRNH